MAEDMEKNQGWRTSSTMVFDQNPEESVEVFTPSSDSEPACLKYYGPADETGNRLYHGRSFCSETLDKLHKESIYHHYF